MVAVNYLWDDEEDNIIREYDDVGNTIVEYTTEPELYGNVISQNRGGTTSYLHFDAQGNTTELTNSAGVVTDVICYSAFGDVTDRTGTTELTFQYVGQKGYQRDEPLAEYLVRRRILLTAMARWLTFDPVGNSNMRRDMYFFTLYGYARNNPLNRCDPSGLACKICWKAKKFIGDLKDNGKIVMCFYQFEEDADHPDNRQLISAPNSQRKAQECGCKWLVDCTALPNPLPSYVMPVGPSKRSKNVFQSETYCPSADEIKSRCTGIVGINCNPKSSISTKECLEICNDDSKRSERICKLIKDKALKKLCELTVSASKELCRSFCELDAILIPEPEVPK